MRARSRGPARCSLLSELLEPVRSGQRRLPLRCASALSLTASPVPCGRSAPRLRALLSAVL
eukprot:7629071-Lingulodinium_polyedra.AAC.1